MKIDILSDLHLDFYFSPKEKIIANEVKKIFTPILLNDNNIVGDVLIIAGDIGHYNDQNIQILKILQQEYYKYIICILGNHDYYLINRIQEDDYDVNSFNRVNEMRSLINNIDNMYCLDGNVIEINGIKFGGCDSWYNNAYLLEQYPNSIFSKRSMNNQWKNSINDARFIRGIENYDDIYNIELPKIKNIYQKCDVMITHVNPSIDPNTISPRFGKQQSNTFFCFDGHEFLNNGSMKYWIFGHTHDEIEYEYSGVKCICNPMGYPNESNYGKWIEMKSIEV